jgi:UDP-N-acetylmuramyl pentapeptide synthase
MTNTFSLNDEQANLTVEKVEYSLDETTVEMTYKNVKTINENVVSGKIAIKTFAPGPHHVSNVLGVVLTCISLEMDADKIKKGIRNYKGIPGTTNKKTIGNSIVIEEINPGLNTQSIKESINMINNLDDYYASIGGDYGITCEEIDESKLTDYLRLLDKRVVLTGQLGHNLKRQLSSDNFTYSSSLNITLQNMLKDENTNIIMVIYRSEYAKKVKLDII